ncbi:TPA: Clp protease [Serratia marcescens]|nr:Clp protease [Serratia marcescens]
MGKPAAATEVTRVFLARADVSQLKEQYSGEAGEQFARAIRENCNVWFPLKQNKEHK